MSITNYMFFGHFMSFCYDVDINFRRSLKSPDTREMGIGTFLFR